MKTAEASESPDTGTRSQSGKGGTYVFWLDFRNRRPVVSAAPPLLREGPPLQLLFAPAAAAAIATTSAPSSALRGLGT